MPRIGSDPSFPGVPGGKRASSRQADDGGQAGAGGPASAARFRALLEKPPRRPREPATRPDEDGGGAAATTALLAPPPPWARLEGPPRLPPPTRLSGGACAALSAAGPADRLLVGTGPAGAEARLQIGHGPLAGSEIHLRHGPAGLEALVLTTVESSRKTLSMAMDEVARRLERRGHMLRPSQGCARSASAWAPVGPRPHSSSAAGAGRSPDRR